MAKTFADARTTCKADGADIAYIPDRFAQQELKELIQNKKNIFPHYEPVEFLWLGGQYDSGAWGWVSTDNRFEEYTAWADGTPGSGCIGACLDEALAVSVANDYQWKAKDPTDPWPFVCITRCKKDFVWFPKLQRCLMVKEGGRYAGIARL